MNLRGNLSSSNTPALSNGSGAAAILAAGVGAFALAILACAADKLETLKNLLIFSKPAGPLSGVTTLAILIWIFTWIILEWRWSRKSVTMARINIVALVLLVLSLLLTFPPIMDLL